MTVFFADQFLPPDVGERIFLEGDAEPPRLPRLSLEDGVGILVSRFEGEYGCDIITRFSVYFLTMNRKNKCVDVTITAAQRLCLLDAELW